MGPLHGRAPACLRNRIWGGRPRGQRRNGNRRGRRATRRSVAIPGSTRVPRAPPLCHTSYIFSGTEIAVAPGFAACKRCSRGAARGPLNIASVVMGVLVSLPTKSDRYSDLSAPVVIRNGRMTRVVAAATRPAAGSSSSARCRDEEGVFGGVNADFQRSGRCFDLESIRARSVVGLQLPAWNRAARWRRVSGVPRCATAARVHVEPAGRGR